MTDETAITEDDIQDEVVDDIPEIIQKFAKFDNDGFPLAFYSSEVHGGLVPTDAIDISDEHWIDLLNNAGYRRWDGSDVVEYTPPPPEPIDPLTLPITKRQMLGVLADMGIDAEPIIDGAIEAIEHTQTRAQYRNDWRYAGGFVRQHPLFNDPDFMALLGMTSEQIDTLWVAAQGYPA